MNIVRTFFFYLMASAAALNVPALGAPSTDFQLRDQPAVFGGASTAPLVPRETPAGEEAPASNPLWAIPINTLSVTRDRPIFLPSRRPPPPAVPSAAPSQVNPVVTPVATEPEKPEFSLVGVISGGSDGIAIFTHDTSRDVFRLRMGEAYNGWILRSVRAREAVLEKNRQNAVLEIPSPLTGQK
ncbi:MAG: hypothetical protein QOD74_2715 [Variibacter sp.]|nr:hypothetical protein [Variibacter sp.]